MSHKLKVPGTILLLLLAIGTMVAPPASAQFEFEVQEFTVLKVSSSAVQKVQVKKGGTTVECKSLTVESGEVIVLSKTATKIDITPQFTECEPLFGQNVTVSPSSCDYVLHLQKGKTVGPTDFVCNSADGIEIKVGTTCTYKIAQQVGLSSVSYKNKGASAEREIEVQPAIEGLTVTRTKNEFPFICPAGSSEGTYSGNSTWTAGVAEAQVGIWVD